MSNIDTNKASEELEANVLEIVESHFRPTDSSLMPLNATKRIMQLIRTEKLKLLAEVRERVVGEDLPLPEEIMAQTGTRLYNKIKSEEREELTKLEAEL